jgi:hypothetical protein
MHSRRVTWRLVAALVAVSFLAACGGPPGEQLPADSRQVSGKVVLPPGHGVDMASLEVVTPYGAYPVAADGSFSALVIDAGEAELGVELPGGELLLLGSTGGGATDLSLQSTAEALLYYAVGGMWLPLEQQDTIRSLLRGAPEAASVASQLQRLLLAGGNGLTGPDGEFEDALEAARASLLVDYKLRVAAERVGYCPALLVPAQSGTQSVIIHGGTDEQAGAMLLHNPQGLGVVAMNGLRRPAALVAYEVEWEDLEGEVHAVEPPVEVARVDVPATDNLELFAAIGDVLTGDAPWRPVLSPALVLPGRDGAALTRYEVVLVGPTLAGDVLPIATDPRFFSLHDDWDELKFDKTLELFLDEMLVPLLEAYALGQVAKLSSAKLAQFRESVKSIYDSHLLELGVYLKTDTVGGYAAGMRFVLEELAVNKTLRLDMIEMVIEALELSDRRKLSVEAIDARLAARAAASAIAFAVEAVLVGGDVTKILSDLTGTPAVAGWSVEAMPAKFLIEPPSATITRDNALAQFQVVSVGDIPDGYYVFKWSTSGLHGVVDDLMGHEGVVIETQAPAVHYFHDDPLTVNADHVDTILVEVFVFDGPVDAIPDDARPVGKGQAVVRGQGPDDPLCVWECDEDGICTIWCP